MLWHVLKAGAAVRPVMSVVVLSTAIANDSAWHEADFPVEVAIQEPPLGTADAVKSALSVIPEVDWLLVLFADHPLLTADTVLRLIERAREAQALVAILSCEVDDAGGYARVERDGRGQVTRIIERKDDDAAARSGRTEINSGMMVVDARWVRDALNRIQPSAVTGEYYLPELVRLAVEEHDGKIAWPVEAVAGAAEDLLGINDRVEQAAADALLRERVRRRHMLAGVTMVMPETISIDEGVEIGVDTTLLPFTVIERGSKIGSRCRIGPHAVVSGSTIRDNVVVRGSTLVDASMEPYSDAGPYAHLRSGARIGAGAHIGNYAEIKDSQIGERVRIGHVSYVGDATVGAESNIGAGTITCNFDGTDKHRTEIGAGVFIGSDTMLVAPVEVGDGARTGAGSVVTKNVPAGATVVGVPARQIASQKQANDQVKSGDSTEEGTP
jgi:bifunctional UDP-N-acetylglucosamine pyrophosphorylase/glucosamine-1-phosphate N-acetyltransferase